MLPTNVTITTNLKITHLGECGSTVKRDNYLRGDAIQKHGYCIVGL